MLVISSSMVLAADPGVNLTHPLIGPGGDFNLATLGAVSATTEASGFPASNLANPSTALKWRGVVDNPSAYEYVTISTGSIDPVDYVAVARHNWGSAAIPVAVGYFDTSSPPVWVELVQEVLLADDGPVMFRFDPQSRANVSIRLDVGTVAPEAAVVYCGKLIVMERGLHVPGQHVPLDFGRDANVADGMSESGEFLGRIVLGSLSDSQADFQHLTPAWFRTYLDPFIEGSKEWPFFFAWAPSEYPYEVGYAWMLGNPKPSVDTVTRRVSVQLTMRGVV